MKTLKNKDQIIKKIIRESTIEAKVVQYAKSKGWKVYKFVSPGNRAVPDRIFFKKGICFLIEFKVPGKKPTKLQEKTFNDLRQEGFTVVVVDHVARGKLVIDSIQTYED